MKSLLENILLIEEYINKSDKIGNDKNRLNQIIENIKNEAILQNKKQNFYISALNALPNPIFVKDENGKFTFFNKAYKQYFHLADGDYIGETVLSLDYIPLKERKNYHREDTRLIETATSVHHSKKFHVADGAENITLYWSCGFKTEDLQKGLIGEMVDVTIQKKLQEKLTKTINELNKATIEIENTKKHDFLTNLYNRYELLSVIDILEAIQSHEPCSVSVLFADLDFFKSINDDYGHSEGDKTLIKFSDILKETCRKDDILIRYGGEEFLVILLHTELDEAKDIGERIRSRCESQLILPNGKNITVSIGAVKFLADETFEQCLMRADKALYEAKANGKNQIVTK